MSPRHEQDHPGAPEFTNPACRDMPFETFFGPHQAEKDHARKTRIAKAKTVCGTCNYQTPCLEFALETGAHGIWGGTTLHERNRIIAQAENQRQLRVAARRTQ